MSPNERRPDTAAGATRSTAGEDLSSGLSLSHPAEMAELTEPEQSRLTELEQTVSAGLATFVRVGNALAEINASRLYRATHATFAAYVADRFGVSRSYAYRQIAAAKLAAAVSPVGDIVNESQARELDGLDVGQATKVWQRANETTAGKPTARAVREARMVVELERRLSHHDSALRQASLVAIARAIKRDPAVASVAQEALGAPSTQAVQNAVLFDPVVAADLVRLAIETHPRAAMAASQSLEDRREAAPKPKVRDRGKSERFVAALAAVTGADRYLRQFVDAASGGSWTEDEATSFEAALDQMASVLDIIRTALRSGSWDDELDKLTGDDGVGA